MRIPSWLIGHGESGTLAYAPALTRKRGYHCPVMRGSVATCGYNRDMETGIRELKDNLSRYIRRVEAGQRIAVTAHGRVVAELVPPGTATRESRRNRWDELIASGALHPPVETGDPFEDLPDIRLAPGTAAELINADRGEA